MKKPKSPKYTTAATEADVSPEIRLALSRAGATLFRNNQGLAWYGAARDQPVKYGLGVGTGDLIGWVPVVITPDMVGKTIAVFTSVEIKRPVGGRPADEQKNFILRVCEAGGFAGFASSGDEALLVIGKKLPTKLL